MLLKDFKRVTVPDDKYTGVIVIPTLVLNHDKAVELAATMRTFDPEWKACVVVVESDTAREGYEETQKELDEFGLTADYWLKIPERLSFSKAVNVGFEFATAKMMNTKILIMQSDDAHHDNWSWYWDAMKLLEDNPRLAVVSYPENIVPVPNWKIWSFRHFSGAVWATTPRRVANIGFLDERYIVGTFEDTDYWHRCLREGYVGVTDYSSPVTHQQNMTGRLLPEFKTAEKINEQAFKEKWGVDPMERYH